MPDRIEPKPILFFKRTHPPVFLASIGILLAFILYSTIFTKQAGTVFELVQNFIIEFFSKTLRKGTPFIFLYLQGCGLSDIDFSCPEKPE